MQIIISHVNTDFDALASMLAAKKLYPQGKLVLTDKQNDAVKQFLAIYRDTFDFVSEHQLDWSSVTELIMVDVASLSRIGDYAQELNLAELKITVYDHHPPQEGDVSPQQGIIEPVGATVTLLIEEIRKRSLIINTFEATLFGLGIYTDTGSFTYSTTTARDLQAASFLIEQGMNLEIIQRFSEQMLFQPQQEILNHLFFHSSEYKLEGLNIVVSSYQQKKFQGGLATLTRKLLEMTGADAVLTVVEMQKRVYIVGRANSERINFLPLLSKWNGGGHEQAGSAMLKNAELETILNQVTASLELILKPAITAQAMMTSPVKTIPPDMTIEEAGELMYRYGHTGFPIVKEGKLLGIISRRDLDKATHHGLGHAPVKGYMTSQVITAEPKTSLEEIQQIMIKHDIGRLPVVEDGQIVGILSRTNVIEILHNQSLKENLQHAASKSTQHNINTKMREQLPGDIFLLLKKIGQTATCVQTSVYLIGGIVRDIILGHDNDDIDLVVEGDGIAFAKRLETDFGGEVLIHEDFGTATWTHPTGLKIDVTSSRLEYYDRPAALPHVEKSTLREDLYRRDFTINAMAICLNEKRFGQLVDPFQGQIHLTQKTIKVLHNLSFVEDPTRIIRAVRFETRFQFLMDEQTQKLALISMDKIKALSATRVCYELEKLFSEANPANALKRLFELKFWQQWGIDEGCANISFTHAQQLNLLFKNSNVKEILNIKPSWFLYVLIPFYSAHKLEIAQHFALTKKENKLLKETVELVRLSEWQNINKHGELQRLLKPFSTEVLLFHSAKESLERQQFILEYVHKREQIPTFLTGKDLKQYGLKPSPLFANILFELEVAILNGLVTTKEEAVAWLEKHIQTSNSS